MTEGTHEPLPRDLHGDFVSSPSSDDFFFLEQIVDACRATVTVAVKGRS